MHGDIVYRVYGLHDGREKDQFFGAFRTQAQAEAEIAKLLSKQMHGRNWADQYHDKGFVVREASVETDFEIPALPKPRERYAVRCRAKPNRPGTWDSTIVEVCRRSSDGLKSICQYERNYSMLGTFEPFRRGSREFALISRDYTRTAVLDLESGRVVAEEEEKPGAAPGHGFCPVGFYVPDWWDLHDGSVIPGSEYWSVDQEWPTGAFGFVWGCYWGDDSSWKVQYLDLSAVEDGVIRRDERFGYVELAVSGYASPCLAPDQEPHDSRPPHFITVTRHAGSTRVVFSVEMSFDLASGRPREWQRLKVDNFE
jgi:hypothetical protein